MKKITAFFVIASLLLVSFSSCKKDNRGNEIKSVSLDVTVNAGETYQLDLSQYADADDLTSITQQAASFLVSEITKNAATGNYIYKFSKAGSPKTGGNGTEKVILKVSEPQGRCRDKDETNITINFTIL